MRLFGKERKIRSETQPSPEPIIPFLLDEQLKLELIIKNVLRAIGHDISSLSKENLTEFFVEHQEGIVKIIDGLVRLIPSEIPPEYLAEIEVALLSGRQVVLLGPHWSVADTASFIKVVQKLRQRKTLADGGINPIVLGPASTKFFDTTRPDTMFGSTLMNSLDQFGLELFQIAQVQDNTITGVERAKVNLKAWKQIISGMKKGKILGIFPEGTRAQGPGAGRAPIEVGNALLKILRDDALIVPIATFGSHRFLGKGMNVPNFLHLFTQKIVMSKPMTKLQMMQLYVEMGDSIVLNDQEPIHPVEVPIIQILANADKKYWGKFTDVIELLNNTL